MLLALSVNLTELLGVLVAALNVYVSPFWRDMNPPRA